MFDGSVPSRNVNLDGDLSEDGSVDGSVTEGSRFCFLPFHYWFFRMTESHVELSKVIVL
jgi:hypothetical protein